MKTQGDSLYDIVDKRDHGAVQAQLLQSGVECDVTQDVAFFCRMNMSRTLKRQAGFGDVKVSVYNYTYYYLCVVVCMSMCDCVCVLSLCVYV